MLTVCLYIVWYIGYDISVIIINGTSIWHIFKQYTLSKEYIVDIYYAVIKWAMGIKPLKVWFCKRKYVIHQMESISKEKFIKRMFLKINKKYESDQVAVQLQFFKYTIVLGRHTSFHESLENHITGNADKYSRYDQ